MYIGLQEVRVNNWQNILLKIIFTKDLPCNRRHHSPNLVIGKYLKLETLKCISFNFKRTLQTFKEANET